MVRQKISHENALDFHTCAAACIVPGWAGWGGGGAAARHRRTPAGRARGAARPPDPAEASEELSTQRTRARSFGWCKRLKPERGESGDEEGGREGGREGGEPSPPCCLRRASRSRKPRQPLRLG
jgi:hypothetical protein